MSRLYAVTRKLEDIVTHFNIDVHRADEIPSETIEGGPGLIVLEKDGLRLLKSVTWGFPRRTREMLKDGEPPGRIGLVADLTNPLWDRIVVEPKYRCLIVLTHFANPDGVKGSKTRTWFSHHRQPLMAWAGFVRNTAEFGPVFAGMTMTANEKIKPLNDRMPVLLKPEEYERWLHGSIQDVIAFQFRKPPASEEFEVLQTRDRWQSGTPPPQAFRRRDKVII
ncbi:SOS response-associated peptidase family protein [Pararhizobium arenae]|uniref:SOS response-associated peptidase family protein n=1 Tax=Pararhizobium arenae TaxID=1856850 RepID=UPI00094AB96B|nr:SOS response-associated peptidase family protein [Pararhizobium arenae]